MGKMIKVQMGFTKSTLKDDTTIETANNVKFTVGELRNFLREQNINPSDIFAAEKISSDPQLKEHIDSQVKFEIEYRDKKLNEQLEKEIEKDEKSSLIPED